MASNGSKCVSQRLYYFTCTLGEALKIGAVGDIPHPNTVSDFIDYQADHCHDHHAVGYPVPNGYEEPWDSTLLSV